MKEESDCDQLSHRKRCGAGGGGIGWNRLACLQQSQNVTEEIRRACTQGGVCNWGMPGPGRGAIERTRWASDGKSRESGRMLKEIGFIYYSSVHEHVVTGNPFWSHILYGVEAETRKSNIKVTYRAIGEIAHTPDAVAHDAF